MKARANPAARPDDAFIVAYHLGQISEEDEGRFEERFLLDERLFERVGMMEDLLIDRYVRADLPGAERELIERRLLRSPRGRRRVAVALALQDLAESDPGAFAEGARAPGPPQERRHESRPGRPTAAACASSSRSTETERRSTRATRSGTGRRCWLA